MSDACIVVEPPPETWPHPKAAGLGKIPQQAARPPPELAKLNDITQICGCDRIAAASPVAGDGPVPLPPDFYRGNHGLRPHYDLIMVGAGLSGCIFAERATREYGKTCLIVDKRDHIGGNCYDFIDEHGFRVSQCVFPEPYSP